MEGSTLAVHTESVSADGTCFIEPRLAPGVSSASTSIKEIALAAATVTRNCVQNQAPTTGGLVERFGSVSIGQTSSETTEDK